MKDLDLNVGPPRGGQRQPYHHGELRPALIQSAREILEAEGLEALTLRGVARRAGVSRQAPYHHFADKHALLAAVASDGFRELASESVKRMQSESDRQRRLNASGVGYVVFAAENPALFQLMFGGLGGRFRSDPELEASRRASFDVLRDAVSAVTTDTSAGEDRSNALSALKAWALVHGLADLLIKGVVVPGDFSVPGSEALAELILAGPTLSP